MIHISFALFRTGFVIMTLHQDSAENLGSQNTIPFIQQLISLGRRYSDITGLE